MSSPPCSKPGRDAPAIRMTVVSAAPKAEPCNDRASPVLIRASHEARPDEEHFVDADRAAKFLDIHRETIIRWARKGIIPAHPLGGGRRRLWRFLFSELAAWAGSKVQSGYRPCSER